MDNTAVCAWSAPNIHSLLVNLKSTYWLYLPSLVFGKNFRKIGVNTSGQESIKWWHHKCVSHYYSFCIHVCQSESNICGGLSQHHEYLFKTSNDIIIICFPDKTIFILLDCFTQLLQIQRLTKYNQYVTSTKICGVQFLVFYKSLSQSCDFNKKVDWVPDCSHQYHIKETPLSP